MFWTREVVGAINAGGSKGLTQYGQKCTAELNKIVSLVRGQLTSLERATCGALVVIDVHARDVTVQVSFHRRSQTYACCLCLRASNMQSSCRGLVATPAVGRTTQSRHRRLFSVMGAQGTNNRPMCPALRAPPLSHAPHHEPGEVPAST